MASNASSSVAGVRYSSQWSIILSAHSTLSPCGRGWRVASEASNEPSERSLRENSSYEETPSPASLTTLARHPLPQGERGRAPCLWHSQSITPEHHSAATLCAADTPRAFTTTLMASSTRSLA